MHCQRWRICTRQIEVQLPFSVHICTSVWAAFVLGSWNEPTAHPPTHNPWKTVAELKTRMAIHGWRAPTTSVTELACGWGVTKGGEGSLWVGVMCTTCRSFICIDINDLYKHIFGCLVFVLNHVRLSVTLLSQVNAKILFLLDIMIWIICQKIMAKIYILATHLRIAH